MRTQFLPAGGVPGPVTAVSPLGNPYVVAFMPWAEKVSFHVAWPMPWVKTAGRNQAVPDVGMEWLINAPVNRRRYDRLVVAGAESDILLADATLEVRLKVPPRNARYAAGLIAAVLGAPDFEDESLLRRVRTGIAEQRSDDLADFEQQRYRVQRFAILGRQPFRDHHELDDIRAIQEVSREECEAWLSETAVGRGALVAVAGPLPVEEAGALVDRLLSPLPQRSAPLSPAVTARAASGTVHLRYPQSPRAEVAVLAQAPPVSGFGPMEDALDTLVAMALLTAGEGAILDSHPAFGDHHTVRLEKVPYTEHIRWMFVGGEVEPGRLRAARDALVAGYRRLREAPLPSSLVAGFGERLAADLVDGLMDEARTSADMLKYLQTNRRPADVLNLPRMAQRATAAELHRFASRYYPPAEELLVIAVSRETGALPGACVITRPEDVLACR
jgi:predicted Zn-dependent peptidase